MAVFSLPSKNGNLWVQGWQTPQVYLMLCVIHVLLMAPQRVDYVERESHNKSVGLPDWYDNIIAK